MTRADGLKPMVEPVTLMTKDIPGGSRAMVYSECSEYLVLDCCGGVVTRIRVFDSKDFMKAAADYKGENI